MKKLMPICLVLALLVSVLAACGTTGGKTNETGETGETGSQQETDYTEQTTVALDEYGRPLIESSLPDGLDYNNEQVNIMIRSCNQTRFIGSNESQATAIDQTLYMRNKAVEEMLNVYIKFHIVEQNGADVTGYNTAVRGYLSGDGEMDIVTGYAYFTPALAVSGCFADLNDISMLDMTSVVWNQTFMDAVAYDGSLYFNVGDFSFDYLRQITAVYFNKTLANNYLGSSDLLYDMVADNSWTIENAAVMLRDIHIDVNQDGAQDANDFYAFALGATSSPCEAMVTALGFNYTYKDSDGQYQLFDMNTSLSDKIDTIHTFISSEFCAPRSLWNWSIAKDMFAKQNVLFYVAPLDLADSFTAVEFRYGFLPMFKYDESQKNYCTGVGDSFSLQCIMANSSDRERAGAVLQCLNEVSYRSLTPEYFNILLMGRFADSPEDAEMLELIRGTVTLDFGRIYSSSLNRVTGYVWNNFVDASADYSTWYSGNASTMRELLDTLQTVLKSGNVSAVE